jgi:hypothetical protein
MGRFADAGRRDEQAEMTAQQGTTEDPTTARQRGQVEAIEEFRSQAYRLSEAVRATSGLGRSTCCGPP